MQYAYARPTRRIVSCKLNLQQPYDSRTPYECRRILKHVLKPYDSRSQNQSVRADLDGTISLRLSYATFVARATSAKQKSYTTRHPNILIVPVRLS